MFTKTKNYGEKSFEEITQPKAEAVFDIFLPEVVQKVTLVNSNSALHVHFVTFGITVFMKVFICHHFLSCS